MWRLYITSVKISSVFTERYHPYKIWYLSRPSRAICQQDRNNDQDNENLGPKGLNLYGFRIVKFGSVFAQVRPEKIWASWAHRWAQALSGEIIKSVHILGLRAFKLFSKHENRPSSLQDMYQTTLVPVSLLPWAPKTKILHTSKKNSSNELIQCKLFAK